MSMFNPAKRKAEYMEKHPEVAERPKAKYVSFAEIKANRTAQPTVREAWVEHRTERNTQTGAELRADQAMASTSFKHVTYLGGLPEEPRAASLEGNLFATQDHIGCGTLSAKNHVVRWADCTGVTVEGGQVAKSKVGAELAFGVLGGLGAKGAADRAFLHVYRNDGAAACYQIGKKSPQAVRAQLTPLLAKAAVPFLDGPMPQAPPAAAPVSVADELAKLAVLREQGVLTLEEFNLQKAALLAT